MSQENVEAVREGFGRFELGDFSGFDEALASEALLIGRVTHETAAAAVA
jgi:hypothetical protein